MTGTILRSRTQQLLAKTWKADGTIVPSARVSWFSAEERKIESLDDIIDILDVVEGDPRVALVKEAIADGANCNRLRRRCEPGIDKNTGEIYSSGLRVVERSWLVLDIDGLPRPKTVDWADGQGLATVARGILPAFMKEAGCVWQLSGSSGHVKKRDEIRMHLFFMCNKPVIPASWKGCFDHLPVVDQSAFDKSHLIFTAAPVIVDGEDPITKRHGKLSGNLEFSVPTDVYERNQDLLSGVKINVMPAAKLVRASMPIAAAIFVKIISTSNVLRSQHANYDRNRSRRLSFCSMLCANFGISDHEVLSDAFQQACVGKEDQNGSHDMQQALDWVNQLSTTGFSFSIRKLLCDAAIALRMMRENELAVQASQLVIVFDRIEKESDL